jgi:hypothetical protein
LNISRRTLGGTILFLALLVGLAAVSARGQDAPVTFDQDNLLTATAGASGFNDKAHSMVFGHNWVINPNAIASSRFAYNRITARKQGARFFNPEDVGIGQWTSVPNHFIVGVTGNFSFGSGPLALREAAAREPDRPAGQAGEEPIELHENIGRDG